VRIHDCWLRCIRCFTWINLRCSIEFLTILSVIWNLFSTESSRTSYYEWVLDTCHFRLQQWVIILLGFHDFSWRVLKDWFVSRSRYFTWDNMLFAFLWWQSLCILLNNLNFSFTLIIHMNPWRLPVSLVVGMRKILLIALIGYLFFSLFYILRAFVYAI